MPVQTNCPTCKRGGATMQITPQDKSQKTAIYAYLSASSPSAPLFGFLLRSWGPAVVQSHDEAGGAQGPLTRRHE